MRAWKFPWCAGPWGRGCQAGEELGGWLGDDIERLGRVSPEPPWASKEPAELPQRASTRRWGFELAELWMISTPP